MIYQQYSSLNHALPLSAGDSRSLVNTIDYDTDSTKEVQYKVLKMTDSKLNLEMASITVVPDVR